MAVTRAAPAAAAPPGARALHPRAAAGLPRPGRRHGAGPLVRARSGVYGLLGSRDLQGLRPPRRRGAPTTCSRSRSGRSDDLVELYGMPAEKVDRHAARRRSRPSAPQAERDSYLLFVGAIQPRKEPLAAIDAAHAVGLQLVVVGPEKERASSPPSCARRGADAARLRPAGRARRALPRAACLVLPVALRGLRPAGARGDGVRDAGRRRAGARDAARSPATRRSSPTDELADGIRQALADRERLVARQGSRARRPSPGARRRAARSTSTARCSA